jgi:rhodanese-related sulfurtransferase/DNA-binding transcriptional ArsR family regulator
MTGREAKDTLHAQFSRLGKVVASPRRIELLELLAQAERSVEELARMTGMPIGNTSAQLQVLNRARLVESRRRGKQVFYRLADESVDRFLVALRQLARTRLAEVEQVARDFFDARDELEPVSGPELLERIRQRQVQVIDVRPREEYEAGHVPGAVSVPLPDLKERLAELPRELELVAYCRGPYCVLAPQAIEMLRQAGFRARRLVVGFPEWRLARLPVAKDAVA